MADDAATDDLIADDVDDEESTLEEESPTRVMGVGVGVFLIVFFAIFSLLVCMFGSQTRYKKMFNAVGAGIFGLVVILLLAADRKDRFREETDTVEDYDSTVVPRSLVGIFLLLSALVSTGVYAATHLLKPTYAHIIEDTGQSSWAWRG